MPKTPDPLPADCDTENGANESTQLINTLYINLIVFTFLVIFFECNRHVRSIYQKRLTKDKFVRSGRVPAAAPGGYFLGWVWALSKISEDDLLEMVGLDGYMLMRYINICFRICAFLTFWGIAVLVPVYGYSDGKRCGWSRFTLANIPNDYTATQLWAPTVLAYVFSAYFCQMMHSEYKNFLEKRVQYLVRGDPATPQQAYYTVMVERIPAALRSVTRLRAFFENLFPNDVYAVELASDLHALDELVAERRAVRDRLEKAIAMWKATGERPTIVLSEDFYEDSPDPLLPVRKRGFRLLQLLRLVDIDAIEHLSRVLTALNESVVEKQRSHPSFANAGDGAGGAAGGKALKTARAVEVTNNSLQRAAGIQERNKDRMRRVDLDYSRDRRGGEMMEGDGGGGGKKETAASHGDLRGAAAPTASSEITTTYPPGYPTSLLNAAAAHAGASSGTSAAVSTLPRNQVAGGGHVIKARKAAMHASHSAPHLPPRAASKAFEVEGLAKEGMKTVEATAKGAVRGVLEAARTLELLTVGAYYATSSTAFVTFKSRTASSTAQQMILSHAHFTMIVRAAPNPKDIIWENVSIPQRQIDIRRNIADVTLVVGALFWSIVLGFITTISNLESLSQEYPWLQAYSGTEVYKFVNSYLASSLLLGLLSLLPVIFDVIARNYEGLKLESEIQNSIMTRYFYYQLANVFVSVYAGSIMTALHQILDSPSNIFSILGATIPSFSVYFANVIIVKTFTALPLELLRVLALVQILSLKMCLDKKKCTLRELRTGAFADPPLLYGWIYPSLMMVLMIVITYACISPLLTPFGLLYYALAYLMYKYQVCADPHRPLLLYLSVFRLSRTPKKCIVQPTTLYLLSPLIPLHTPQLLYVYVNDYQSGGFMWYAVFTRSMTALICGMVTLICYLGIRKTNISGPFYALIPLPLLVSLFWYYCEAKFRDTSTSLSLESAIDLDRKSADFCREGIDPFSSFQRKQFRQPALAEGPLRPAPYRKEHANSPWSTTRDGAMEDGEGPMLSFEEASPDRSSHAYRLQQSYPSHEFEGEDSGDEGEIYTQVMELLEASPRREALTPVGSPKREAAAGGAGAGEGAGVGVVGRLGSSLSPFFARNKRDEESGLEMEGSPILDKSRPSYSAV